MKSLQNQQPITNPIKKQPQRKEKNMKLLKKAAHNI